MTAEEVNSLADSALNVALAHIQDEMGVYDGMFAGVYFSGEEEGYDEAVQILERYIRAEQQLGCFKDDCV